LLFAQAFKAPPGAYVAAPASLYYAGGAVCRAFVPEPVQSSPAPRRVAVVTPTKTERKTTPVKVKRFPTVEAYFSDGNPNPLSYRKGEPLYERDVSNSRKKAIKERDGGCCLVCGSTIQLEVDHRIALMNGCDNTDENLGTLCDSCHVEKTRYDWAIKRRRRKGE